MSQLLRPVRVALEAEIKSWPGASMQEEPPGAHPRARIRYGDQHRLLVSSSTPRNIDDCAANAVQDLRRLLREMGAAREDDGRRSSGEKRGYRQTAPPRPTEVVISDPRSGGGLGDLSRVITGFARQRLLRWNGLRVTPEKESEAALALLEAWHPDIIVAAAALIESVRQEEQNDDAFETLDRDSHRAEGARR